MALADVPVVFVVGGDDAVGTFQRNWAWRFAIALHLALRGSRERFWSFDDELWMAWFNGSVNG
jgi:hypothetical protein